MYYLSSMKRLPVGLFFLAIVLFIISNLYKIQHWPGTGEMILLGLVIHLLIIGLVCKEIIQSKAKDGDKFTWLLLFIGVVLAGIFFFGVLVFWLVLFVTEAAYLFSGRKKITGVQN